MTFKTIAEFDLAGKVVLVRADLNVPMRDGVVTDTTRLDRFVPTVRALRAAGARIVVLSHFGRPQGNMVPGMSLAPVADALQAALGDAPVAFAPACIGAVAREAVARLGPGDVVLLENLRFHAGEEGNDPGFAAALAELGDVFVNDAFSAAHRAHASTTALAGLLPAAAGLLMQAELEALSTVLGAPERPLVAVVGGAKISTKLALLENLLARVDALVLGGGMANTFLNAGGTDVGASLCETEMAETARSILSKAAERDCRIALPEDAVVAAAVAADVPTATVEIGQVPADRMILDIGPKSVAGLTHLLDGAKSVVWNGPLGVFEVPPFAAGTTSVARHVADLTEAGSILSVAGGGDTVAALAQAGVAGRFSYVSTAGGAFLEWLEGKTLPGVAALTREADR